MKNQLFALIGLGLLLATASAYAQTGVVKANVPFNFIVNKTDLPAGAYMIQPVGTYRKRDGDREPGQQSHKAGSAERVRIDRGAEDHASWFSTATASQYFLAQIWTAGKRPGHRNCRRAAASAKSRWTTRPRMLS